VTRDLRLVVFDCDGTLVDSQNIIHEAMRRAFEARGHTLPERETVLSIVGLSLPLAVARLVPHLDEGEVARLSDLYRLAFAELRQDAAWHEPLFPGAREVVDALHGCERTVLSIATGKSRRGVVALLDRHGLSRHFPTYSTADDGPSKPDPFMLRRLMDIYGIAPEATVMVGDTSYDMEMARNAGATAIGVGWGYHRAQALEAAGAHSVITRFDALDTALEAALRGGAQELANVR
jgi:phosphoglycolate phosphatase